MANEKYRFIEKFCDSDFSIRIPKVFEQASIIYVADNSEGLASGKTNTFFENKERSSSLKLRILHFNDLHHLLFGKGKWLLSRIAELRDGAEKAGEKVLSVSAGDDHVGSIFDAFLEFSRPAEKHSPAYRIYNELPLDFLTIGNHDLDFGFKSLAHILTNDALFPVFTSNIRHSSLPGYTGMIGSIEGWKIGIIGITTVDELHVRENRQKGIYFEEAISYVSSFIDYLEGRIDFLMVLSHLGLFIKDRSSNDIALAHMLSETCPVPSIIIGAHSHTRINPSKKVYRESGIPIFQAGAFGEAFGDITVKLKEKGGDAHESSIECRVDGRLYQAPKNEMEEENYSRIDTLINEELSGLYRFTEKNAGRVDRPSSLPRLSSCDKFGLESPTANMITDAMVATAEPLLSDFSIDARNVVAACDSTCFREWYPNEDGTIQVKDWYEIIPYADTIYAGWLSVEELQDLLEMNALRFLPPSLFTEHGGFVHTDDWDIVLRGRLHFSKEIMYSLVLDNNNGEPCCPMTREELINFKLPAHPKNVAFAWETVEEKREILLLVSSTVALGGQGWDSWDPFSHSSRRFFDTEVSLRRAMVEAADSGYVFSPIIDKRLVTPWD